MMTTILRAPIAFDVCTWWNVRQVRAYHRRYPDVWGEGRSRRAALAHLAHQLTRILDSAPDRGHRAAIERAIDEVRAFGREAGRRRLARRNSTPAIAE